LKTLVLFELLRRQGAIELLEGLGSHGIKLLRELPSFSKPEPRLIPGTDSLNIQSVGLKYRLLAFKASHKYRDDESNLLI
jgi:hypothetical protein